MSDTFKAVYACPKYSGFNFRLGDKRYVFEKHQLILDNKDEADALDDFLKTSVSFASKIKKVDLATAEALVANHVKEHGGAHSGPFSSQIMTNMEQKPLVDRDNQFANLPKGAADKITEALAAESDLIVTAKVPVVEQPVIVAKLVDNTPVPKAAIIVNKLNLNKA